MEREKFIEAKAKELLALMKKGDRNEDFLTGWITIHLNEIWTNGYSKGIDKAVEIIGKVT